MPYYTAFDGRAAYLWRDGGEVIGVTSETGVSNLHSFRKITTKIDLRQNRVILEGVPGDFSGLITVVLEFNPEGVFKKRFRASDPTGRYKKPLWSNLAYIAKNYRGLLRIGQTARLVKLVEDHGHFLLSLIREEGRSSNSTYSILDNTPGLSIKLGHDKALVEMAFLPSRILKEYRRVLMWVPYGDYTFEEIITGKSDFFDPETFANHMRKGVFIPETFETAPGELREELMQWCIDRVKAKNPEMGDEGAATVFDQWVTRYEYADIITPVAGEIVSPNRLLIQSGADSKTAIDFADTHDVAILLSYSGNPYFVNRFNYAPGGRSFSSLFSDNILTDTQYDSIGLPEQDKDKVFRVWQDFADYGMIYKADEKSVRWFSFEPLTYGYKTTEYYQEYSIFRTYHIISNNTLVIRVGDIHREHNWDRPIRRSMFPSEILSFFREPDPAAIKELVDIEDINPILDETNPDSLRSMMALL